jgi:hypothetical protein
MNDHFQTKSAVTVAEMSRMVNLSRSRFYQLIGSAFPEPCRDENGRPFYNEEQQQVCIGVRQRNCGVNGKPILFYARRVTTTPQPRHNKIKTCLDKRDDHSNVLDAVRALGLASVTARQVSAAVRNLYPAGTDGVAESEVIRSVFVSIQRKNTEQ